MNGSLHHLDNGRWRVRWRDPDGRGRSRTFDGKADARQWLGYVRHKTAVAELPLPTTMTVGDWADMWLEARRDAVRASTWIDYESILRNHLPSSWQGQQLTAVARASAQKVIADLAATGRSGRARKVRAVLGSMFNEAIAEGHCTANPFRAARVPSEAPRSRGDARIGGPRCPSPRDVWRLADAAPEWARPIVLLGGFAGLRWGEIVALEVDDLDLDRCEVSISRSYSTATRSVGPPKTDAANRMAIYPTEIVPILTEAMDRASGQHLFVTESGGRIDHSNFRMRVWKHATAAVGVEARFHDLRHTYASILIAGGTSAPLVAALMGHSSPAVTLRVYASYWDEQLLTARRALGAIASAPTAESTRQDS